MRLAILAIALALAACQNAPPISASLTQDISAAAAPLEPTTGPSLHSAIAQGLQDASWDLDQAVGVGALDANDPAPGCFHSVLSDLGLDPANPTAAAPSFTPRVSDLISGGAVLYIRARQAQKLASSGGPSFSLPCKALIGQFVLDAGKATARAGTTLIPGLGPIGALLPVKLPQ